jgi:hypothetical protein
MDNLVLIGLPLCLQRTAVQFGDNEKNSYKKKTHNYFLSLQPNKIKVALAAFCFV